MLDNCSPTDEFWISNMFILYKRQFEKIYSNDIILKHIKFLSILNYYLLVIYKANNGSSTGKLSKVKWFYNFKMKIYIILNTLGWNINATMVKNTWGTLFTVPTRGAHLLSLAIGPEYPIYNVDVKGLPVLSTPSLWSS